ncbi:winged helix-turn-helix domain-containing protein [Elioraea rosea]|uniref:winged helix-turn-helix domain-containing protein n=1 Tax=Elioraea rosea TaxID=2492390 RepID=UPI0011824659|nr:response regulator transcription factor [Elioraea rosea]
MRILLVEDDSETAAYVRRGLIEAGHTVDHAADGQEGLFLASGGGHDVLVVDRMLPKLDGLSLVRALRAAGVTAPAIFLTARAGVGDRVEGLDAGGDDYLAKPFAFAELLARVNALARRPRLQQETTLLRVGDLEMDLLRHTVSRAGQRITLQPREWRLLEFLMRRKGEVATRTMLLEAVWDFHFDPMTSVVETHISRLRSKIDKGFDRPLIHTVRGAGYVVRDDG